MSEQLYRVCWQVEGFPVHYHDELISKAQAEAEAAAENLRWEWAENIRHWIEPVPYYTPPAITHEGDLETAAGSPGCADSEYLLGVKPPC